MEFGNHSAFDMPDSWDDISLGTPNNSPAVARPRPLGESNVNLPAAAAADVGEDVVGDYPRRRSDILTWDAYTHAIVLAHNIKVRTAWNPDHQTKCVYVARKGFENHPGVVKFTFENARKLHLWLKMVLLQARNQADRSELIPYFESQEHYAMERINYADRLHFWRHSDLEFPLLKVRLSYSSTYQDYSLHLLNPVPVAVSERFSGWPGTLITLHGAASMQKLCNYIESVVEVVQSVH